MRRKLCNFVNEQYLHQSNRLRNIHSNKPITFETTSIVNSPSFGDIDLMKKSEVEKCTFNTTYKVWNNLHSLLSFFPLGNKQEISLTAMKINMQHIVQFISFFHISCHVNHPKSNDSFPPKSAFALQYYFFGTMNSLKRGHKCRIKPKREPKMPWFQDAN